MIDKIQTSDHYAGWSSLRFPVSYSVKCRRTTRSGLLRTNTKHLHVHMLDLAHLALYKLKADSSSIRIEIKSSLVQAADSGIAFLVMS